MGCFHIFCFLYFPQQRKFLFTWYVFAVNYTAIVLSNDCFVWIAYSFWQLLRNKLHNPFCQHSAILVFSIVIFSTSSKLKKPLLFFWGRFICNMTHVAVAFGCFFCCKNNKTNSKEIFHLHLVLILASRRSLAPLLIITGRLKIIWRTFSVLTRWPYNIRDFKKKLWYNPILLVVNIFFMNKLHWNLPVLWKENRHLDKFNLAIIFTEISDISFYCCNNLCQIKSGKA